MRPDGTSRVDIAIVTARNAPAHERVVRTLRAWGTPADEAHFVGLYEKTPILEGLRPGPLCRVNLLNGESALWQIGFVYLRDGFEPMI
jgi:5'-nucleotidase